MGGQQSTVDEHQKIKALKKSQTELVKLMMPTYYSELDVTDAEIDITSKSWRMILDDQSPRFLALRDTEGFEYSSCMALFYDSFYHRLFDIHPLSKELFKRGIKSQGKFLVKMISLGLSELSDVQKYEKTFMGLAEMHNRIGVKAIEYGIVGEVLFWSLKNSLGEEVYTDQVHHGWTKVFSRMLRTMVPVAVAYELENGASAAAQGRIKSKEAAAEGMYYTEGDSTKENVKKRAPGSGIEDSVSLMRGLGHHDHSKSQSVSISVSVNALQAQQQQRGGALKGIRPTASNDSVSFAHHSNDTAVNPSKTTTASTTITATNATAPNKIKSNAMVPEAAPTMSNSMSNTGSGDGETTTAGTSPETSVALTSSPAAVPDTKSTATAATAIAATATATATATSCTPSSTPSNTSSSAAAAVDVANVVGTGGVGKEKDAEEVRAAATTTAAGVGAVKVAKKAVK